MVIQRLALASVVLPLLANAPGSGVPASSNLRASFVQSSVQSPGASLPPSVPAMIERAALEAGVPADMALYVAWRESRFDPKKVHVNAPGYGRDFGVFQLNGHTVQVLHVADPLDARQNIAAGVGLLAAYLRQFHGDQAKALCAFARGPQRCRGVH